MRIHFKLLALCWILLGAADPAYTQIKYPIIVSTMAVPPVDPKIAIAFANPVGGVNVLLRNTSKTVYPDLKVIGKLQRLSPSGFSIEKTTQDLSNVPFIPLGGFGATYSLSNYELTAAFGFFQEQNLQITGVVLNDLRDPTEAIRLPPGQYRICFYVVRGSVDTLASDPNLGCAFFNICKIDPPQFTRPTSNFSIGSNITVIQAASPVNFAWTPPMTACGSPGAVNYELEIREVFNNQNVTDAINNPVIFFKTGIPSPTFLLDLNLYPNILQPGKKYVVRVKAAVINTASPVAIENNGYSRVEAFQFGSENAVTPNTVWNAQSYYLPLEERKSAFWNDYDRRGGKDTLVPVAEYIAYKLMQDGVAYSQDAIELLASLNPGLKDVKEVKLKQPVELPVFPELTDLESRHFDSAYAADLQPNTFETTRFKKYLDSLRQSNYKQRASERVSSEITELIGHLDQFQEGVSRMNGTSLSFINASLSELLFELRRLRGNISNNEYDHLHEIISDVKALAVIVPPGAGGHTSGAAAIHRWKGLFAVPEPLLPVDVIVYRPVPSPRKPIMNAPDLKGVFRVFYTSRALYNNKNPEINAKSPGPLASTTQVSLPGYLKYKFWTLNMINHKLTLPQDIDIEGLISNLGKEGLKGKRATVVLKVE